MKHMVLGLAALLLGGCTAHLQTAPVQLSAQQIETIKAMVKNELKDPFSAHIEDVRGGYRSNGTLVACGYVNARNSFGGYVGRRTFLVEGSDVLIGDHEMGGAVPALLCNAFFQERASQRMVLR